MSIRHRLGHGLLAKFVDQGGMSFVNASADIERVQRENLAVLLKDVAGMDTRFPVNELWTWEQFAKKLPPTGYDEWQQPILAQMNGQGGSITRSPVQRYQPTSGSSSAIKWIPYTRRFLHELDQAISPWLSDLYRVYPRIGMGSHYWSLSWVPTDMRQKMNGHINDDIKLLSGGKRFLASLTQAVPESVSLAHTSDDSMFGMLTYLVAERELAVMSVWSPTFALSMFERLAEWRNEISEVLRQGHWGDRSEALKNLECPRSPAGAAILSGWDGRLQAAFFNVLWPKLALVSAWDTASAKPWAKNLRELLPMADFQGKGLWATEGVVTIPFRNKFPLAYRSHVYEFEDVIDGRILPPWKLEKDQQVTPLLSTGGGLLRYRMNDCLRVSDYLGRVPCFEFMGRNDGTDFVGEKISAVTAQAVIDSLDYGANLQPVTLLALEKAEPVNKPAYVLLLEGNIQHSMRTLTGLEDALETNLRKHFHYDLARNLNQLAPARVVCCTNMRDRYLEMCRSRGMIEGNIKIEPLKAWNGQQPRWLLPVTLLQRVEVSI